MPVERSAGEPLNPDDILLCSRTHLAPYQRIRRIEFSDLPKTISGKIRRVELRQREERIARGEEIADEWRDDRVRGAVRDPVDRDAVDDAG